MISALLRLQNAKTEPPIRVDSHAWIGSSEKKIAANACLWRSFIGDQVYRQAQESTCL